MKDSVLSLGQDKQDLRSLWILCSRLELYRSGLNSRNKTGGHGGYSSMMESINLKGRCTLKGTKERVQMSTPYY